MFECCNLLVFPAASNPNIRIRISLLPNILERAFDRLAPISLVYSYYEGREGGCILCCFRVEEEKREKKNSFTAASPKYILYLVQHGKGGLNRNCSNSSIQQRKRETW